MRGTEVEGIEQERGPIGKHHANHGMALRADQHMPRGRERPHVAKAIGRSCTESAATTPLPMENVKKLCPAAVEPLSTVVALVCHKTGIWMRTSYRRTGGGAIGQRRDRNCRALPRAFSTLRNCLCDFVQAATEAEGKEDEERERTATAQGRHGRTVEAGEEKDKEINKAIIKKHD